MTNTHTHSQKHLESEAHQDHFRVAIFGSARIDQSDPVYQDVFSLAEQLGQQHFDVVTGGGPGLMEAANAGHRKGSNGNGSHSIGLTIELPFEAEGNKHLDMKQHFEKFSNRLDTFMVLSQAVVVMPGGIGTCLELFYSWQLTQVKHICNIPIILYGQMWENLIEWITSNPLKQGYMNASDLNNILIAKDTDQVMQKITQLNEIYQKEGDNFCLNYKKYKIN